MQLVAGHLNQRAPYATEEKLMPYDPLCFTVLWSEWEAQLQSCSPKEQNKKWNKNWNKERGTKEQMIGLPQIRPASPRR